MTTYPPPKKKLQRSRSDRLLGGVCGGLAGYLNVDATLVRVLFALLTVFSLGTIGVVAYVVALLVMPEEEAGSLDAEASTGPTPPPADPGPPPVFEAQDAMSEDAMSEDAMAEDPVHPDPVPGRQFDDDQFSDGPAAPTTPSSPGESTDPPRPADGDPR